MKNVAFLFSGLTRTFDGALPSYLRLQEQLLEQKYQPYWYISVPFGDPCIHKIFDSGIKWSGIHIAPDRTHDVEKYSNRTRHPENLRQNLLRQWDSWGRVWRLCWNDFLESSLEFEWYFRLRTDSILEGPLENLFELNNDNIYLPKHDNWGGYCDRFAFGGYRSMERYMTIGRRLKDNWPACTLHAETMLRYTLENPEPVAPIRVERTNIVVKKLMYDGRIDNITTHTEPYNP